MLNFQSPDCALTLRQGLRELLSSREDLVTELSASSSAEFFRCHDVAHVVFGCSTTLTNEVMVKIWSFFGTTAGLSLVRDYRSSDSKEIYEQIGWREVPGTAVRSMVSVPIVLFRCQRMRKRWPWSEFERYMDVPLNEIRKEFGITIVTTS